MKHSIILLFILLTKTLYAQIGRVEPFDESAKDAALVSFIAQLKQAVEKRDKEFIRGCLAKESYVPIEGEETTTPDEFYNYYFEQGTKESKLWVSLEYIFSIGGGGFKTLKNGELRYYMPYTAANLHEGVPFTELGTHIIALSDTTKVYYKPSGERAIIAFLDYDIVPVNVQTYIPGWIEVELQDGETGYVMAKDVIYTIDTRCGFVLEDGEWKLKFAGAFE